MNASLHTIALQPLDWLHLFFYYLSISLLAVGGAVSTAPDMHRYLVQQQGWLSDTQFNASIALAQAAPGPNLLFIALLGWNVGLNASGGSAAAWAWGSLGLLLCMLGALLPSTTLTWMATRWALRNRQRRSVRAFKQGMAPVVVGLLWSTAWLLASTQGNALAAPAPWCLALVCALLVWRTKLHLLWLLGAGALLGALGWV